MITLHHLENSRSQRVLWMLEELQVPYEIKLYKRDPISSLAPSSLKKVHKLGKAPIIEDNGVVIAESGAILEYLAKTYGKNSFIPDESNMIYWQYSYWLHFAEGSMMPYLVMKRLFESVKTAPMPFFIKPIAKGIATKVFKSYIDPAITANLDIVEAHLSNNTWFAGQQLTVADFMMSFPLEAWVARNNNSQDYPNIRAYVKNIQQRPAYQEGLAKGGHYDYALAL